MTMESPVRICIGAALVVNLLLLSSSLVSGNALPHETTSTTVKDEKNIRYGRINGTSWVPKQNDKLTNITKEINPKETASDEHTEKNAKYKHRGRVRYNPLVTSTTEAAVRRVRTTSTEATNLIIVTPTPEVMKPAQIIDSMRTYKRTKMPMKSTTPSTSISPSTSSSTSSSTSPSTSTTSVSIVKSESESQSEEDEEYEDDDEEDKESFEKYTANDFDSNFFTIPSYNDDFDFSKHKNSNKKIKEPYSSPSFSGFSTFFPSFGPKDDNDDHASYKSESFFSDFESELTTPKNDFFDKKYEEISKSILKNLASIKATEKPKNATNIHKIVNENMGIGKRGNEAPTNKSTVYIKNTKEIRVLDNEGRASSANSALSDVQGTSIYYEMSVLSTETYAIDNSDDDCDNDTMHIEPTLSTSMEEELASLKAPHTTLPPGGPSKPTYPDPSTNSIKPSSESISALNKRLYVSPNARPTKSSYSDPSPSPNKPILISSKPTSASTKPTYPDPSSESISTLSSNYLPVSNVVPTVYNAGSPVPISTQNIVNTISSTEKGVKVYSSSYTRNRSYSKRLNLNGTKDSLNSVTSRAETTVAPSYKPLTRRFYQTTPKTRHYWMTPRRNITRISPTRPTTIYSEHFNIRDKYTTTATTARPKELISQHNKTTLTTVSSDIDPVLQSDIGGVEKVVHSPSIADNSIPSVWKRGSTKYVTSTATSVETGGISDLEIPPTLTAWALASLRSPPALPSTVVNSTTITKTIDENELQKVGEVADKKEATIRSTSTTTANTLNNDIESKKIVEPEQNKLPWKPIFAPTPTKSQAQSETTQMKPERQPAESIITAQSSPPHTTTTESTVLETVVPTTEILQQTTKQTWVHVTSQVEKTTTDSIPDYVKVLKIISPNDTTNSTLKGFESITKLPSGLTTPQDETVASSEQKSQATNETLPTTTDYEITTIRFSYVPTEETTEANESDETETTTTTTTWHVVFPTRTKITTIKDAPVTTYRPVYATTTDLAEETTTVLPETSFPPTEASPESETKTESIPDTTEIVTEATTITTSLISMTEEPSTEQVLLTTSQNLLPIEMSTSIETTTLPETTSIVTEIITEINTEIQSKPITTETTTATEVTETPPSNLTDSVSTSEENIDSNEIITKDTVKSTTTIKTTSEVETTPKITTPETKLETTQETTTLETEETTARNGKTYDTTVIDDTSGESTTDLRSTEIGDEGEFTRDMTTEAIPRVAGENEETGSGAAVAITVSTIGVIALILLIGLLLVVRRRGRRGVYAQRCTPVSLDAYSLDSVSVGHRKGNHRLRASKRSYGNPAYDDEVTSHPMQYAALANFALDVESMTAEFAEIPSVTVRPDEVPPGCEDKNRYSNVLPLPETRVPLKRIGNDPTTEYINANFITGPGNIKNYYIACQAPLSNTVVDFWRMIWEQNSRIIVMLTEYMENGVEKCYEYLPPSEISDNKRTFADYQIILKKREQRDKYAISTVQLINLVTRTWREVTHMWFFWPAKGVPDDYDAVIDFLSEMRSYMKISQTAKEYDEEGVEVIYGDQNRSSFGNLSKLRSDDSGSGNGLNVYSPAKAEEQMRRGNVTNGTLGRMKAASEIEGVRPCVVTCASGAGRAAALIAADVCARALAAGAADVPRVVRELRAQRPHSLSNRHHYIFLYKVLSEYGNKLMGGGVDTI